MRIIPRSEWGARHGDGRYVTALPAREMWLHHSVTIAPDLVAPFDDDDAAIRIIEDIGADRFGSVYGFPYTWGITPVGRIYQGHAVNKTGAHTQGHNTVGRAIVLVGNYERDEPTDAQVHAIAWLLNHAHARGWIATPQLTGGHRDTKATACPGRHAYARIPEINRLAATPDHPQEEDVPPIFVRKQGTEPVFEVVGSFRTHVNETTWSLYRDADGEPVPTSVKVGWVRDLPADHEVWTFPVVENLGGSGLPDHRHKSGSVVR